MDSGGQALQLTTRLAHMQWELPRMGLKPHAETVGVPVFLSAAISERKTTMLSAIGVFWIERIAL